MTLEHDESVQTKAVDTWNYYQAKSMKQNLAEATLDELHAVAPTSSAGDTQAGALRRLPREDFARYERARRKTSRKQLRATNIA